MKYKSLNDIRSLLFDNLTVRQTIFKNTFWLTVGTVINRFLKAILIIYAARILGATEYGKFTFALAFISLFVIFHDFGLSQIVIREFAREKEEEFSSVISLKILLSCVTLIIILIGSFLVTIDPGIREVIIILGIFNLVEGFAAIIHAFFQARQRMEYQAWVVIFEGLVVTTVGFFVILKFPSIGNLSYAYLFSSFAALIFALIFFNFKIFRLTIRWDKKIWQRFLIMSWPLALTGLFGTLYTYIDSVMMGYWGMITETGWYNAAYRIIMVILIPMGLISGSFFPVLSKLFKESKERLQNAWNYQMEIMILLAIPLVTGGILLAPKIIDFFYGQAFSPSVLAFQILIIMAGIMFLYGPFSDVLVASNQQKKIFWVTLCGALINIILNLILIPKFSLYGAAVATVITYLVILLTYFRYTMKFTSIHAFKLKFLFTFLLAGFSSFLMYLVIIQPSIYNLNIFLSMSIGVLVYFVPVFIIKKLIKPIYEKA